VNIFVENNRAMGNISERDYNAYMELFHVMMRMVRLPDLLIYLRCSVPHLVGQIQKRGRDYEQGISLDYLKGLNDRYEKWIEEYKGEVIVIDADRLDFVANPEDFGTVTNQIEARLFGLFGSNRV
jgi:deoxyadenosine/deoxycytidine kinase